jgi:integrase
MRRRHLLQDSSLRPAGFWWYHSGGRFWYWCVSDRNECSWWNDADIAPFRRRGGECVEFPNWNVHQIRHAWATHVRALHSLEAAQATLGHASLDATQIYAEKSAHLAIEIARKMG